MNNEYSVTVESGANRIEFLFVKACDALEFAGTCLECGNDEIVVHITKIKED